MVELERLKLTKIISENMKIFFKFFAISYATALIFEIIANTIGDGTLFQADNWFIFFLIWYGLIYAILYLLFRNRPIWQGVIFFSILGTVIEPTFFKRSDLVFDPIVYAIMGLVPLWVHQKFIAGKHD